MGGRLGPVGDEFKRHARPALAAGRARDTRVRERILGSLQSRRESRKDSAGFWDAKGGP